MITGFQTAATALARAWVRLYTSGMPPDLRAARRAEIDADLWEHQQDARENGVFRATTAMEILLRTLLGVPDDIGWRLETLKARRGGAIDGRTGTMAISVKQIRWMGLCAVLSGALYSGGGLTLSRFENPGRVYTSDTSWHLGGTVGNLIMFGGSITMLCFMLGVVGLYFLQRGRIGKAGSAGFILLLTGFGSLVVAGALLMILGWDGGSVFNVVFTILWLAGLFFLMPLGFLLFAIGLPSPSRRVPLILVCIVVANLLINLSGFKLGSALGIVSGVLPGLCLALIGYSVWSGTRTASMSEANR